ncbi:MAG: hypothetical protein QG601_2634, partial [Pseudomonadota bacterium]|nr:hypothetical protein [Pseudomonadota bacterium]
MASAILKLDSRRRQNSSRLSQTVDMLKREISPRRAASTPASPPA